MFKTKNYEKLIKKEIEDLESLKKVMIESFDRDYKNEEYFKALGVDCMRHYSNSFERINAQISVLKKILEEDED